MSMTFEICFSERSSTLPKAPSMYSNRFTNDGQSVWQTRHPWQTSKTRSNSFRVSFGSQNSGLRTSKFSISGSAFLSGRHGLGSCGHGRSGPEGRIVLDFSRRIRWDRSDEFGILGTGLLVFLAFTSLPVLVTPIVADVRGDPASWAVLVPITLILLSSLTVLMRLLRQVDPAHARPRSAH
jgi:hypothetical protein